jgi:hypothetical protein
MDNVMKNRVLAFFNVLFLASFINTGFSQVGLGLGVTDKDVTELNRYFHKTYSKEEWSELKVLDLKSWKLPVHAFPDSFNKLRKQIQIVDLRPNKKSACLNITELTIANNEAREDVIKSLDPQTKPQICLGGILYDFENAIDAGGEGRVLKLEINGKFYALKLYFDPTNTFGAPTDLLVLSKAETSRPHLNLPLLVNKIEAYSLFPYLSGGTLGFPANGTRTEEEEWYNVTSYEIVKLNDILDKELKKDGLAPADSHGSNWMRDKKGNFKRIDFGGFHLSK